MDRLKGMTEISVVIPAHNEEKNIASTFREIQSALENSTAEWEIIFVDDGSRDGTTAAVRSLMPTCSRVRLIQLARNFGHQAALMAGLSAAKGQAVISMDCDLQHPPRYIPEMIDAWRAGHLVVDMERERTIGISRSKHTLSVGFYRLINLLSSVPISEGVSDFRLLDRIVVEQLIKINDPKPFIRGLVAWLGFKPKTIKYTADERRFGQPSYTLRKSLRLAQHALLSLSQEPLRFSIYVSIGLFLLCFIYIAYVIVASLTGNVVAGWPSIIVSVLTLGGIQLMSLGVLGEYVAQIFERTRNLPAYVALPESPPNTQARETP